MPPWRTVNLNLDQLAMHKRILSFLTAFVLAAIVALPVHADSAAEASQRIKERLEQVDQMKASGTVGEDARGYLEVRETLGPRQQALVEAENADRRILYAEVARRTQQSVEAVGQQRAIQIAARATPGVWLQKPGGDWYRK